VENVQKYHILKIVNDQFISIHFYCEDLTQMQVVTSQHIRKAHLCINEFVTELGKEQFWVFLSHLMEILADLGI
jgi:hypothetical protein